MSSPPTSRRDARERALELIYEAECKDVPVADVLKSLPLQPDAFASALALGVDEHVDDANELIRQFTRADWPIERMPLIDRLVLRLAIEELDHHPDTPRGVILDEAVELAKTFSTEDSGRFVNGMLTSIADHLGREPLGR